MANTIQIKRRVSGNAGSPPTLKSGEVAHNEVDNTLYVGKGDDGSGNATSIVPLAGKGAFADLTSPQTIAGTKTFTLPPKSAQDASGATDLVRKSQMEAGLSAKADASHSHVVSDVTGLQSSLDAKAPLTSPALTGTPTAPTANSGTNTTQILVKDTAGTSNYFSLAENSSGQGQLFLRNPANSVITRLGTGRSYFLTSVGIATADPQSLFHIQGDGSRSVLRVATNASQVASIFLSAAPRIGIMTESPLATMDIQPIVGTPALQVRSSTLNKPWFRVQSGGYIGISTASPVARLHVEAGGLSHLLLSKLHQASKPAFLISTQGNAGFGTWTPQSSVQISGGGLCVGSDASCNTDNNSVGVVYATSTTVQGADYAEYFPASERLQRGDLVGLNPENGMTRRYIAGDVLLGVVPDNPGFIGNRRAKGKQSNLVALIGQVRIDEK